MLKRSKMFARVVTWMVMGASLVRAPVGAAQERPPGLAELSDSFERLASRVAPAVVEVFVTSYGPIGGDALGAGALLGSQRRAGSGVILSSDGYVVTNAHVVRGGRRLRVSLPSSVGSGAPGRSLIKPVGKQVDARIVGIDRETDLAVLKIDESGLLFLELGDSDELRPGQLVFAFGSPLGLANSVSMGVVSAVARQLEPEAPMAYIQTDATINPGNSGGPLVNARGLVVGVNTLIFSQSGGSEGIGFAAPSNIVRSVFQQIRANGRVRRGEIGVYAQTITPTLAAGLRLRREWGVILGDVRPRSPAANVGLRAGDIILALNGKPMENARQLDVNIYGRSVGDTVTLGVLRGAEQFEARVLVLQLADDPSRFAELATPAEHLVRRLGVLAVEYGSELAPMLPWIRQSTGVVIAALALDVPFRDVGLEPGDVVYAVNSIPTPTVRQLRAVLEGVGLGDPAVFRIDRRGRFMYVALNLE